MRVGREPVVRTALKLLGDVGLEGLTLRAIAAALGVRAPTLYWRFRNKQDLIDEMATQVLADWAAEFGSASGPRSWSEVMRRLGLTLRAALLRHRDGARMVAGTRLRNPAIYGSMEAALEAFQAAGVAPTQAAMCLKTVNDYVVGFTIEQQAVLSPSGERNPGYELAARAAAVDPDLYPLTRAVGPVLFDDYDAAFEFGLNLIIAGFATVLAERIVGKTAEPL
ncbi:MAG: TetR family transcriptional regulator [Caulobacteraceae bacterium]|jgi:TetR/AcrR family tetracycline transcriptional repressor|nr:TetR family transcriptional regulator [Caulobacteraceae bacterium]